MAFLGVLSVLLFVCSLIAIPLLVIILPSDYFLRTPPTRQTSSKLKYTSYLALSLMRNILGAVLILAGIVMLFIPGQGLITSLIGVSLSDFPKKRELEFKLLGQPKIINTINEIRKKAGKSPFLLPENKEKHTL